MLMNLRTQPNPDHMPTRYCSYLVRLWQSHPQAPMRASALDVQTGETIRFADLESLFAFLQKQGAADRSMPDVSRPPYLYPE